MKKTHNREARTRSSKSKPKIPFYKRTSFWQGVSVVLIIIVLLLLFPKSQETQSSKTMSASLMKARVTAFLQKSLAPGTTITVDDVQDAGQVYRLQATVNLNESATVYASKDGKYLFPGALDMTAVLPLTNDITGSSERVEVSIDDDAVLGDESAPVTIVEFSDYQCPLCGSFAISTFKQIKQEYIDTGKVKFVFRDYPLPYHSFAQKAAEASECAHEQGKFWEYNEKLFANQNSLANDKFTTFAAELGLDVMQFTDCLNSGKYYEETQNDFADGTALRIQGTPTFFINGIPVSGAMPFNSFKKIIDSELGYS
ncbi:MAG: DsbA family protein [Nanoarchaeota archaeon]|nr:DsbA family protein [Nanoarchaeota archaeon]